VEIPRSFVLISTFSGKITGLSGSAMAVIEKS